MAFQISPGVNTSEIDLTTVVPGVSSIDAGFAGAFRWGPINDITLIDSEDLLVQTFQKPDANTFASFFTAANILNYTNSLHLEQKIHTQQVELLLHSSQIVQYITIPMMRDKLE